MDDHKTEVVEKRLNRGVIRRRSSTVDDKPEAKKAEVPAQLSADTVKKKEAAPVLEPAPSPVVTAKPAVPATKESTSPLKVKSEPVVKSQDVVPMAGPVVVEAKPEEFSAEKKPVAKKEERKAILSFKDRIRGTINLNKPATEDSSASAARREFGTPDKDVIETEAEKKEKALKAKRVKNIGGDLDIEGLGKSTHLSQLVRAVPLERVFRPGVGGSGGARNRKKKIVSKKNIKQTVLTERKAAKRIVHVDQSITVGNLAQALGVKANEIIKHLMNLGTMAAINQAIDKETATLIASEYKYEVKDTSFKEDELLNESSDTAEESQGITRPPVVTVMGHVDHGKTSLLDAIRSTNVTAGEAGGITQHIGAYTVDFAQGQITFLDTPGHEAFTTMRSRGAKVTDIVVLVVAADDGMMPQTIESIDHAKAAGVPIIVAVNKIDKPEADPEKIKRQLSEKGLVSEQWGGDTIFVEVSAKQKTGIDTLLESILLQAEILELKADFEKRAVGSVIEAKLDRARGPVCTLLVQNGKLRVGDYVVAGILPGRVRAMYDWVGNSVEEAGPSTAVEVLGFAGVPEPGDSFNAVESDQDANKIAEFRASDKKRHDLAARQQVTLEDMFSKMKSGEISKLNLILKTDAQGSLEAVRDSVAKIGNEQVTAHIIHSGVGGINESDVTLAKTSNAIIIGFNIRPETSAIHLAKQLGVDIKLYKVIYDLVNEVKLAVQGLLKPDVVENYLGRAEVRQTFQVSKLGVVAGSMVVDGVIQRNARLRLLRDNVVVFEGGVTSLKRFKDDAREVKQGFECGIGIEGHGDIKPGDVIEAFELKEIQKTL